MMAGTVTIMIYQFVAKAGLHKGGSSDSRVQARPEEELVVDLQVELKKKTNNEMAGISKAPPSFCAIVVELAPVLPCEQSCPSRRFCCRALSSLKYVYLILFNKSEKMLKYSMHPFR